MGRTHWSRWYNIPTHVCRNPFFSFRRPITPSAPLPEFRRAISIARPTRLSVRRLRRTVTVPAAESYPLSTQPVRSPRATTRRAAGATRFRRTVTVKPHIRNPLAIKRPENAEGCPGETELPKLGHLPPVVTTVLQDSENIARKREKEKALLLCVPLRRLRLCVSSSQPVSPPTD